MCQCVNICTCLEELSPVENSSSEFTAFQMQVDNCLFRMVSYLCLPQEAD